MKVLVLGAGAVGGYFGGRLAEKGVDVTFLVREKRKQQLVKQGLRIQSIHGDVRLTPQVITAGEDVRPYDLILISTKAYHLADGMEAVQPYVGEQTMLLPLLNGIAHMEVLRQTFGEDRVLGGLCFIESTLDHEGTVVQTSPVHDLVYGEWHGGRGERTRQLEELFANARAGFRASEKIQQEMWHKYHFITMLSGMTTLMRAPVGPIREAAHGRDLTRQLAEEVAAVMRVVGAPIAEDLVERQMNIFEKQGDRMKSSMLRDMEKGLPVEAEHLQGHLLRIAEQHEVPVPLLRIVYNNLKVYESERERER